MIYRLKTRLELANFKRKFGYERVDLYTLESNLIQKKKNITIHKKQKRRHRYYPTNTIHYTTIPTSPQQPNNISPSLLLYPRYPLSAKRSTSPQQQTITEEDNAANVLVMLHNTANDRVSLLI